MLLKELFALKETKYSMYQVKVGNDDWKDVSLGAESLQDIVKSVQASPYDTDAHAKFDVSELTRLVEELVGDGPGGYGPNAGSWDEIEFDVKSFSDDVLKITYALSGIDMSKRDKETTFKKGLITIMPGN